MIPLTGTSNRIPTGTTSRATDARHAYDHGMPLHIVKRRFHLSDSEVEEMAPEEFDDDAQADAVSGY